MSEVITYDMTSPEIVYLCKKDKRLAKVISMVGPISYEKREVSDAYSFLIHEVIEQMLSIKAGKKIFDRVVELCDGNLCPEVITLLSIDDLRSTGTSASKVRSIKSITAAVLAGDLVLEDLESMNNEEVTAKLTQIHGIGPWTAKMYLLFVLRRPDILPYEDGAFLQSYRWMYKTEDCSPAAVKKRCQKWMPYSSLASRFLYRALDYGLVKEEFHLFK